MTVSMGSMSRQIALIATEMGIESDKTSKKLNHAAHVISREELLERNTAKDQANKAQAVMSTIQTVQSAVSVVQAGVKVGQEAKSLAERSDAQPQLESKMDAAKGGDAQAQPDGMKDLKSMKLGSDGAKIGDRWNDEQLAVLTSGEKVTDSKEALVKKGFSEEEAIKLVDQGKDGLSKDEAVEMMWQGRKTGEQQKDEQLRDKMIDAIKDISGQTLNAVFEHSAKKHSDQAKAHQKMHDELDERGDKVRELASEHRTKLGDLDLQGIKSAQDPNKKHK